MRRVRENHACLRGAGHRGPEHPTSNGGGARSKPPKATLWQKHGLISCRHGGTESNVKTMSRTSPQLAQESVAAERRAFEHQRAQLMLPLPWRVCRAVWRTGRGQI